MDMNQLFYHHQMALIEQAAARRNGLRAAAGCDRPAHYAERIEAYRARRGMTAYFLDRPAACQT